MKVPLIPYKEIGNGILSSGVFLSSHLLIGYSLGLSLILGGACYLGYRLLFGTDLSKEDLWRDMDALSAQRAIEQITLARGYIKEISVLNDEIPHEGLSDYLDKLEKTGHKIIELFEHDPSDIRRSKRFIEVYLSGAVSVSRKYAHLHQKTNNEDVHKQYENFLKEMVNVFDKQYHALLDDDIFDIDVEIEVLKKRMQGEAYLD